VPDTVDAHLSCDERDAGAARTPKGTEVRTVIKHTTKRLRTHWPNTRIVWRGDSHYGRVEAMEWAEDNGVDYIFGLAGNTTLDALVAETADNLRFHHAKSSQTKLRTYASFTYQAGSWTRPRKVVARLECSLQPDAGDSTSTGMRQEVDIRYVVTSRLGTWRCHLNTKRDQARTHFANDVLGFRPRRLKRSSAFNREAQDLAISTLNKVPAVGVVVTRPRRRIQRERLFEVVGCPTRGRDRVIDLGAEVLERLQVIGRDELAVSITAASALSIERRVQEVHRGIRRLVRIEAPAIEDGRNIAVDINKPAQAGIAVEQ
jgi:Transposase DDE domain group 1